MVNLDRFLFAEMMKKETLKLGTSLIVVCIWYKLGTKFQLEGTVYLPSCDILFKWSGKRNMKLREILVCQEHSVSYLSSLSPQILWSSRAVASGRLGGPQFLAKKLTLSQPGRQIMPTTVLRAPPPQIFRPCDGPVRPVASGGAGGL